MKSYTLRNLIGLVFFGVIFSSCQSSAPLHHPTTNATLWMQNSAEYDALTTAVFQTAGSYLPLALENTTWTADPQQDPIEVRSLPPAIIVDVDETVLDNSPFQARMIKQEQDFDPEQWNNWVRQAAADPIAGALDFLLLADEQGITIFYITNREAKVEEGTLKNLEDLGFPVSGEHILSQNERKEWTSAKTQRRSYVSNRYRILMIIGDDLNDFVFAKEMSQKERVDLVKKHRRKWGRKWYILPNPVYGSWESALYNFNESLTPDQIDSVRQTRLDDKN